MIFMQNFYIKSQETVDTCLCFVVVNTCRIDIVVKQIHFSQTIKPNVPSRICWYYYGR